MSEAANFTPREIVSELDRYIIGQDKAKRAVAIAIRNRWRRQQVPEPLRDEIYPKNIIMIGPTGVGKTEIARRLAKLVKAPFTKVEASKFTEVGYVGKDVESIIRELTDLAVKMVKEEEMNKNNIKAEDAAEERLLDILVSQGVGAKDCLNEGEDFVTLPKSELRNRLRHKFRSGALDKHFVELEPTRTPRPFPMVEVLSTSSIEELNMNLKDMFSNIFQGGETRHKKVTVKEAFGILKQEEFQKLVDMDSVVKMAIERVETMGIVFLDEIDKIASREKAGHGPDVSREGVQRDLLPIVEGSTVMTKYGMVRTDHILFIAAGAFHVSKPSDLIPELQGRFPIRVELDSLTEEDFFRIIKEPENSLVKQYVELLKTEGVELVFTDDALREICKVAVDINDKMENIGARRLYTVMEAVLSDVSFEAPEMSGGKFVIDAKYVREKISGIVENKDIMRYVL